MQKRTIWIIVLVAVLVVAAIFWVNRWNAARKASATAPQTSTVQRGNLQAIVGTSGTVRAAQSMDLTFGVAGTVVEILVAEGDQVKQGSRWPAWTPRRWRRRSPARNCRCAWPRRTWRT